MYATERYPTPQGFIHAIAHKGSPIFIPWSDKDPKHGRIIVPKWSIIEERHMKNLIVLKGSAFIAKRMRPGTSWGAGIGFLEVGTGYGTGSEATPQAETINDIALKVPLARKAISAHTCLDSGGNPTETDTDVIELTTTFTELEAVGALVEMGLFGGDATATLGSGFMFNYKTFGVWNKQNTFQLTIRWRLYF